MQWGVEKEYSGGGRRAQEEGTQTEDRPHNWIMFVILKGFNIII